MKYIKLRNMVDRYDVLILKDCGEHYLSSDAKKFQREVIQEKIDDSWHFIDEITEKDFIEDIKRRIKCNKRTIEYTTNRLVELGSLLKPEEL